MNQQPYLGNVLVVERASPHGAQLGDALACLGLSVQCAQSIEAAREFATVTPGWMDYLIIDPDLPDGNGTRAFIKQILFGEHPPVVAVIVHQLDDISLLEMAYCGAQLVPKPVGFSGIRLLYRLLERHRCTQDGVIAFARRHHLSRRETEVLEAQFNGAADKMIAQILNTTEHAINQTIRRIHKKLRASTFREIVSQWRQQMASSDSLLDDAPPSSSSS